MGEDSRLFDHIYNTWQDAKRSVITFKKNFSSFLKAGVTLVFFRLLRKILLNKKLLKHQKIENHPERISNIKHFNICLVIFVTCDICHYWYFKDIGFKYGPYRCNGCHDLMQKAMGFNNIAIVYIK